MVDRGGAAAATDGFTVPPVVEGAGEIVGSGRGRHDEAAVH